MVVDVHFLNRAKFEVGMYFIFTLSIISKMIIDIMLIVWVLFHRVEQSDLILLVLGQSSSRVVSLLIVVLDLFINLR